MSTTSLTNNHKDTRRIGREAENDRLLKEINLIGKWCNYGANNGLFCNRNNHNRYDRLKMRIENRSANNESQNLDEIDREKLHEQIHGDLKEVRRQMSCCLSFVLRYSL